MIDYLAVASAAIDMEFVRKHTSKVNELEITTDNSDFKLSTEYIADLMRGIGMADVERYAIPMDGVTTYDDCTMPLAWDRTGRSTLEIVDSKLSLEERMIADTDVQPLNAAIWSPPTPAGGVTAELVSLQKANSDDWSCFAGKIVLCNRTPIGSLMRKLALSGAVGLVSYVENTLESNPDDVRWMNGVGWFGWYYIKRDKPIWNFSITPRQGAALDARLAAGEKIILKAVMNTRVYEGETYTVTGRIPGKSQEEIALFAHMYEPFPTDDASGVVISIAIAKALMEMVKTGAIPPLEKSIRLVFSMERFGFSEYFHNMKNSRKIISGINMDSVCLSTLKLAGILPELRHSPASAPCFDTALMRIYLQKGFPEFPFMENPGTLSDDTFAADTPFNIPTCWLNTPVAVNRHHNTGAVFAEIDWEVAETVYTVITTYLAEVATVRKNHGDKELKSRVVKEIIKDAEHEFKKLQKMLVSGALNSYAGNIVGDFLTKYFTDRIVSLNLIVPELVEKSQIKKKIAKLRKRYAPVSLKLDIYELRNSELRMAHMYVTRDSKVRQIMSLARVPEEDRYNFIAVPEMLLQALLDGKRNLYEAYVISNYMLNRKSDFKETAGLVEFFKRLEKYGYYTIKYADPLKKEDLAAALDALGVKNDAKVVVHSAYGSLGGVEGGPQEVVSLLIGHVAEKGLLMMPSFNFPYYMGKSNDEYFDVRNTPSAVGIIAEEFRKNPEVVRSLNPSHSVAVYGKNNFHWVKDHHKTVTFSEDSPLGKLEKADGYALLIHCPGSVSFMHVVEMTNQVHCLGQRTEEYNTKLPNGKVVPTRTWGWRDGHCIGYREAEIFDYMRKRGLITEVMVRHSLWQCFKLSDYRKAYEKVVMHSKCGCIQCKNAPRQVKQTTISDWDNANNAVRSNTTAFTGDWEWDA